MVELYLHSLIRCHGVVLNGKTLLYPYVAEIKFAYAPAGNRTSVFQAVVKQFVGCNILALRQYIGFDID
jgi:hypothetical protein